MIVSLLYQMTRRLLSVPSVLLRRDTAKDAELLVLRHENAVMRRRLRHRVRYQPADRLWLAALSSLIPRRRWTQIFLVTPDTLLTWHRRLTARKWDYTARRTTPGRPPTRAVVKNLVLRWHERTTAGDTAESKANSPDSATHRRLHRLEHPPCRRHRPSSAPPWDELA